MSRAERQTGVVNSLPGPPNEMQRTALPAKNNLPSSRSASLPPVGSAVLRFAAQRGSHPLQFVQSFASPHLLPALPFLQRFLIQALSILNHHRRAIFQILCHSLERTAHHLLSGLQTAQNLNVFKVANAGFH